MFFCAASIAEQITINWLNTDGTRNRTTSCTIGGDVILPYTPTKYGYTFQGWRANYTPIEYLESTGTQYIDTGYVPDIGDILAIDTTVHITKDVSNTWLTGWYKGPSNSMLLGTYTSKFYFTYNLDNNATYYKLDTINKHRIRFNVNGGIYIDDILVSGTVANNTPLTVTPTRIFIFARYNGSSPDSLIRAKLYDFKIIINGTLVRDFIPVLDKDGTPCMYDKVEGKFYYNAGTGQFIAGPIINE